MTNTSPKAMQFKSVKASLNKLLYLFGLLFVSTLCLAQPCSVYSNSEQVIQLTPAAPCFILRLPSNPTTGYRWQLILPGQSYLQQLIQQVNHRYLPPTESIPGRGGFEEWLFTIKPEAFQQHQTAFIKLLYRRPWESDMPPAQQLTFTIKL